MKKIYSFLLVFVCSASITLFGQNTGIGTGSPSALLELYDSTSAAISNVFLIRSAYKKSMSFPPIGNVLKVTNDGNIGIGSGYYPATGIVDVYGKMGDSVLINLHGSPTPIFGANAVLRFSGNPAYFFDIVASFPENMNDRAIGIGKLSINRFGSVIIGGQPQFGSNGNSFTINHNAAYEGGLPIMLAEFAEKTPVRIGLSNFAAGSYTNWIMSSFSSNNPDSSFIKFQHYTGVSFNRLVQFTGTGKIGVNTVEIAAQAQVQIDGKNITGNTPLLLNGVQEYDDNAAAISAGLPPGALYRTGDLLKIVH